MKLEQQVTSLELSNKLKDLGVKQESYFTWHHCLLNETEDGKTKPYWMLYPKARGDGLDESVSDFPEWYDEEEFDWDKEVSAFTVAELGEMLPKRIGEYKIKFWFTDDERAGCGYVKNSEDGEHYMNSQKDGNGYNVGTNADTEAEARGLCLCYLLKNGLLK